MTFDLLTVWRLRQEEPDWLIEAFSMRGAEAVCGCYSAWRKRKETVNAKLPDMFWELKV